MSVAKPTARANLHGITVVMLDIDPTARSVASAALRGAGCQDFVQTADGPRALDVIASRSVDLVLMDSRMAAPGGMAFLQALRQTGIGRSLPVIIATTSDSGEDASVALNLRVAAWLMKPIQPAALVSHALAALGRSANPADAGALLQLSESYERRLPLGLQDLAQIATRVQTGHRGFTDCADEILALLGTLRTCSGVLGYSLVEELCAILHDLQRKAVQHPAAAAPMQGELIRLLKVGASSMVMLTERRLRGSAGPVGPLILDQLRAPMLDLLARVDEAIAAADARSRATQDAIALRKVEIDTDAVLIRRRISVDG